MRKKLIKSKCEIESCDVSDSNLLELHHIIPRIEQNSCNHPMNLAILCCCHHKMIDTGRLKILGVFPSTKPPNGRILVYELDGIPNIDIDVPYFTFKNKSFKIGKE